MSQNWVLVRGVMSSSMHWHEFLDGLKSSFSRHHFHTPEIIGNGKRHRETTPLTMAENIVGLREQLPAVGKKILLGFSLGGTIAIDWAQTHADEVAGLVLINSGSDLSPAYKRMLPWSMWQSTRIGMLRNSPDREHVVLNMTTRQLPHKKRQIIANYFHDIEARYPSRSDNFLRQLFLATRIRIKPEPPRVPILLLASKNDRVVSVECSKSIAKHWGLPIAIHPKAGHDLTLEDPDWVLKQIRDWYAQNFTTSTSENRQAPEPVASSEPKSIAP